MDVRNWFLKVIKFVKKTMKSNFPLLFLFSKFVKIEEMESVSLKDINELLKDAPKNVLERVFGYIEGILEDENSEFKLSEEQKESLKKIKQRSYDQHTEIDTFLNEMNSKYII